MEAPAGVAAGVWLEERQETTPSPGLVLVDQVCTLEVLDDAL